ncbi:MAG: pyridoxine 5'-phosphate synthase [Kiritimatiellae bacterium]|nr:pyridoxine 5'-phosphate synthase [Kiritimatiellia bacterium]
MRLGVNIDHIASLRQARGTPYPDLVEAAAIVERAGADGITIHLREDRRHIQEADVRSLRETLRTRMNLEMANSPDVVAVALDVVPDEVCMVPERRMELTTEGGLDVAGKFAELEPTVRALRDKGVEVSMFIDPEIRQVEAAARIGAPYIELHTGAYANAAGTARAEELQRIRTAAREAAKLGLKVNAGHGLDYGNLADILAIPELDTLNIGHSIVCRSVFVGLENAVREMLRLIGRE